MTSETELFKTVTSRNVTIYISSDYIVRKKKIEGQSFPIMDDPQVMCVDQILTGKRKLGPKINLKKLQSSERNSCLIERCISAKTTERLTQPGMSYAAHLIHKSRLVHESVNLEWQICMEYC